MAFHNRKLSLHSSKKIAEVVPAITQGYDANLSVYLPRMKCLKNAQFRPMFFPQSGFERGVGGVGECIKVQG